SVQIVELLRSIVVTIDPDNWPSLEMLLEVADSSITYRSRYFTILQAAPVVDLLMNDEANPRSLAFQLKDLARHCGGLSGMPSGSDWPVLKQRQMEAAAARLLHADVESLCETRTGSNRLRLDSLLEDLGAALPAFAQAISNTYFSHAQMERAT
ncbi:MAG: alpha-E domain-containing protein, partial [Acidobacteriaceae bacterium]